MNDDMDQQQDISFKSAVQRKLQRVSSPAHRSISKKKDQYFHETTVQHQSPDG
jgi:hypothetical protein